MKRTALLRTILGSSLAGLLYAAPAHAQATATFVSGVGEDINPCSRTAPCRTFAGAISKTATNGEIRCLDPGGYGAVTIAKSITIDCRDILASITHGSTTGIIINIAAADALKTVRLRNISLNGAGNGTRSGVRGINILAADHVFLDDMRIDGNSGEGVRDARTAANGKLYIRNSIIRDNSGSGVTLAGTGAVQAIIEDSHLNRNNFGVAVAAGNIMLVTRSVMSGNVSAGAEADPSGVLSLDNNTISSNGTGVQANAGSTVRLSNNNIAFNSTGVSGATTSFTNNRIYPVIGTIPTGASPGQL